MIAASSADAGRVMVATHACSILACMVTPILTISIGIWASDGIAIGASVAFFAVFWIAALLSAMGIERAVQRTFGRTAWKPVGAVGERNFDLFPRWCFLISYTLECSLEPACELKCPGEELSTCCCQKMPFGWSNTDRSNLLPARTPLNPSFRQRASDHRMYPAKACQAWMFFVTSGFHFVAARSLSRQS